MSSSWSENATTDWAIDSPSRQFPSPSPVCSPLSADPSVSSFSKHSINLTIPASYAQHSVYMQSE